MSPWVDERIQSEIRLRLLFLDETNWAGIDISSSMVSYTDERVQKWWEGSFEQNVLHPGRVWKCDEGVTQMRKKWEDKTRTFAEQKRKKEYPTLNHNVFCFISQGVVFPQYYNERTFVNSFGFELMREAVFSYTYVSSCCNSRHRVRYVTKCRIRSSSFGKLKK